MTDFLFARPKMLSGFGSVLDLYGTMDIPNTSRTAQEADMMALRSDWITVANDIRAAMTTVDKKRKRTSKNGR